MKKWIVIYTSVSGNTQKLAKAMAEELGCECVNTDNAPEDLSMYDGIVLGYWLRKGAPADKMKVFMQNINNKDVVFLQTHGAYKESEHAVTALARAGALLGRNCNIIGTFSMQCAIAPALLEKRMNMPNDKNHKATPENIAKWKAAAGHPDDEDLISAKKIIAEMVERQERLSKLK